MRRPNLLRSAQVRTYKTYRTSAARIAPDDPLGLGLDDLPAVEREQDREATWKLLDLADDFDSACNQLQERHARKRKAVGCGNFASSNRGSNDAEVSQ